MRSGWVFRRANAGSSPSSAATTTTTGPQMSNTWSLRCSHRRIRRLSCWLSGLLRIADGLDRGHTAAVGNKRRQNSRETHSSSGSRRASSADWDRSPGALHERRTCSQTVETGTEDAATPSTGPAPASHGRLHSPYGTQMFFTWVACAGTPRPRPAAVGPVAARAVVDPGPLHVAGRSRSTSADPSALPKYQTPSTSSCSASTCASASRTPVTMLTTPPGTSEVSSTW